MMLAPMAMHGAKAATAPHHAAVAEHCGDAGERQDDRDRGRSADCAIACSAMPSGTVLAEPVAAPRAAFAGSPSLFFTGTAPGADPPPPRRS
jgi:hypothetical protein